MGLNQLVSYKYEIIDEMRSENKLKRNIGVLGGTFDPPHKGHVKISKEAKKFNLTKVFWAINKKNPFKQKSSLTF